ncbi:hypothetical protein WP1_288 [Pseudomonas phage WP1]
MSPISGSSAGRSIIAANLVVVRWAAASRYPEADIHFRRHPAHPAHLRAPACCRANCERSAVPGDVEANQHHSR